jgi:hypothetical protein
MGISGFDPAFLTGLDAVRREHGSRLAALAGRRLTGFALVRFADERLGQFFGQELREVALLESRPAGRDLASGTVAVEFAFAERRLHIANGLDENSIHVGAAHQGYVRHRLDG